MQELSIQDLNEISGGISKTAIGVGAMIGLTFPISVPIILTAAATKLGFNLCDYYTNWNGVTGWGPTPVMYGPPGPAGAPGPQGVPGPMGPSY